MFEWFLSFWSEDWQAFFIYITGGKHQAFYVSFSLNLIATLFGGILALGFGIMGASAARSRTPILSIPGRLYINMVRGIPDLLFFVFIPLAITLIIKVIRTWMFCEAGTPLFEGINFIGCSASNLFVSPNSTLAFSYDIAVACFALGVIFGAFAANVIRGALDSVPAAQLETARAFGMSERQVFWRIHLPQMWVYAWGGLTNIWMLIIKATSLLSILGIQEAVWYARTQLGPPQNRENQGYMHDDWTVYYFGILFVFYLLFTYVSETSFAWGKRRIGRGMVGAA